MYALVVIKMHSLIHSPYSKFSENNLFLKFRLLVLKITLKNNDLS